MAAAPVGQEAVGGLDTFLVRFTDYGAPYVLLACAIYIGIKLLNALIKSKDDQILRGEANIEKLTNALNGAGVAMNAMALKQEATNKLVEELRHKLDVKGSVP